MGSTVNSGIGGAMRKFIALKDYVTWFEIPAYDMLRAKAFYDHVYGIAMETSRVGEFAMAFFPTDKGVGGAVVQGPGCLPNDTGALLYLNAGEDLELLLGRVAEAGGRVVMGRTLISDGAGWFALFIDTEGNRLALHEKPVASGKAPAKKAAAKKKATKASPRKKAARKVPAKKTAKRAARKAR
jgi:predicted enzyme related to lactoylglutathione lyase